MEKRETNSAEDLHSILSRFQTWSGKHAGAENGNGHGHKRVEGVHEIPYEEALRQVRSRRPARAPRPGADVAAKQPAAQMGELKPESGGGGALPCPATVPAQAAGAAGVRAEEKTAAIEAPRRAAGAKKEAQGAAEPAGKTVKKRAAGASGQRRRTRLKSGGTEPARTARAGKGKEFREVLAKSIERKPAKAGIQRTKEPERMERVSVRLSQAEERRLQECAKRAGMTVSAYLRERALGAVAAESSTKAASGAQGTRTKQEALRAAASTAKSNSVLGDWLALLRNRFLASPTRFAERA